MRYESSFGRRLSWGALATGLTLCPAVASADSGTEWGKRALRLQDQIDTAAPFVDTMWVGTHNSFNAYEWDLAYHADPNQREKPIEQLRHGVREIVFDIHWSTVKTEMLLCHGVCSGGEKTFREGLAQIRDFLDEGNRDEVIMLKIEATKGAIHDKFSKLANQLEGALGARIFKPSSLGLSSGCLGLNPNSASKRAILDAGRNVIVITTPEKGCVSNGAFNEWIFSGFKLDDGTTALKFEHPKSPSDSESIESAVGSQRMLRQLDDATSRSIADGKGGSVEIREANVDDYMRSGLNIFEMFNFNGEGSSTSRPWLKPQHMVWSWRSGEPSNSGGNENCAVSDTHNLIGTSGDRFNDVACDQIHVFACRNAAGDWKVARTDGTFDQGDAACAALSGGGYSFATPVNGREYKKLLDAPRNLLAPIWVNYQDLSMEGQWIANSSVRLPHVTVAAVGGSGGSSFDDKEEMKIDLYRTHHRVVRKVVLRSGARLDSVSFEYGDDTSVSHGGSGGSQHTLNLSLGERINSYEVCVDKHKGSKRVFYLKLRTDKGHEVSGGDKKGASCSSNTYADKHLFALHGRSGEEVDSLGFYFRAN